MQAEKAYILIENKYIFILTLFNKMSRRKYYKKRQMDEEI